MPALTVETFVGPERWENSPGRDRAAGDLTLRVIDPGGYKHATVCHVLAAAMSLVVVDHGRVWVAPNGDVVISCVNEAKAAYVRQLYAREHVVTRIHAALTVLEGL